MTPQNVRFCQGRRTGLFGMVGAVAMIPQIVEFIETLVQKIGQSDFWQTIWEQIKAQWDGFVGLFTKAMNMDARSRGELLGGVLIGVIMLIIEVLTGLAETGVALEFTAAGIMRALKATGKMGLEHIRSVPATIGENITHMRGLVATAGHALPRIVEGAGAVVRGEVDVVAAAGRVTRAAGEYGVNLVKAGVAHDVETASRVHGFFKGQRLSLRPTVGEFQLSEAERSPIFIESGPASGTSKPPKAPEDIKALAANLKVSNFKYYEDVDQAEAYARTLGVSDVDYGGDVRAANITNLGLQRIHDRNVRRVKGGKSALPLPEKITVNPEDTAFTSYIGDGSPIAHTKGGEIILNSRHSYFTAPEATSEAKFGGEFWSSRDPNHPLFHEIGHVVQYNRAKQRILVTIQAKVLA